MATRIFTLQAAREWLDRRFVVAGGVTGLLGGLCCIGGAIAMATGLGALSFFGTLSDRYSPYFIAGSTAVMLVWLVRQTREFGLSRRGLRLAAKSLGRQTLIMAVVYGVTLGLALGAMRVAEVAA